MAENEINWEPQSVADIATALSRIGDTFRSVISQIYSSFNQLGQNQIWTGKNYNIIANTLFNSSISSFESWCDYLQLTIPQTIYEIANQHSIAGHGSGVSYSPSQNSDNIQYINETIEKSDGSQTVDPNEIRIALNSKLPTQCDTLMRFLNDYINQFNELGTLNGNAAILTIYNELDSILQKCNSTLETFKDETLSTVEKTLQNTEMTNQETVELANRLASSLNL